jgi:uncharacterized membrane protein YgcG
MTRTLGRHIVLVALALAAFTFPAAISAIELPPTQAGVAVYDLAGIWQPSTIATAQATADAIRARTQAQLAIVSIPTGESSVSTDEARSDAITIMNTWGVGRAGVNDGLVILFDMDNTLRHGQIYLYAGSGTLDLYLSEDESAAIVNGDMLPKAKDGDLSGALLAGLEKVDRAFQPNGNPDRGTTALLHDLIAGLIVAIGLLGFGLFVRTWWLRGRDARVPLIDDSVLLPAPPPGLTPALATVLRDDAADHESFTSALVDLGHRGLITFQEDEGDAKHVNLVVASPPLDDPASVDARRRPLGEAEEELVNSMGNAAVLGVLGWTELRGGEGKKLYEAFKKSIGKAALAAGWFRDDPTRLTSRWTNTGIGMAVAAAILAWLFVLDTSNDANLVLPGKAYLGWPLLLVFVAGIGMLLLSRFLAARTADGAQTLAMALAYRNTLRFEMAQSDTVEHALVTTSSRLPWITTPDELTVWAVALGLKDDVDRLIKNSFESHDGTNAGVWAPLWFTGSGGFGSVGNVTSMLSSIRTTAVSSSGSGYGGGGGGGGGGAGGGF